MPEQRYPHLWESTFFWFVVIGVAAFKAVSSPTKTWPVVLTSFAAAVFCAMAFAESAIAYLKVSGTPLEHAVVGLVALTGEHIMRLIVALVTDPERAFALWRRWKGGADAK